MHTQSIEAQVKSLEVQLQVLKAKLQQDKEMPPKQSFGDLIGILGGDIQSTEEEIDAVLYHVNVESL